MEHAFVAYRSTEFIHKLNHFQSLLYAACLMLDDGSVNDSFSKKVALYLSKDALDGVWIFEYRIFSLLEILYTELNKSGAFFETRSPFSSSKIAKIYYKELMDLLNQLLGFPLDIEKIASLIRTSKSEDFYENKKISYAFDERLKLNECHEQLSKLYCAIAEINFGQKSSVEPNSYDFILKKSEKNVDNESGLLVKDNRETCEAIARGFYRIAAEHAKWSTEAYFPPQYEVLAYLYEQGGDFKKALSCYIAFSKQNGVPDELIADIELPSGRKIENINIYEKLHSTIVKCGEENLLWRLDKEFCELIMTKKGCLLLNEISKEPTKYESILDDDVAEDETCSTSSEESSPSSSPVKEKRFFAYPTQKNHPKIIEMPIFQEWINSRMCQPETEDNDDESSQEAEAVSPTENEFTKPFSPPLRKLRPGFKI